MRTSAHIFSPRPKTVQHLIPLSLSQRKKRVQRRGTTPHDATKTAKSETQSQKSQGGKTPQDREQNHRPQNPEGARNAPNGKRPRNFWHCGLAALSHRATQQSGKSVDEMRVRINVMSSSMPVALCPCPCPCLCVPPRVLRTGGALPLRARRGR